MANHASSKKRIRQTEKRNEHNRYYKITVRNLVRKLRATTDAEAAKALYPEVASKLDRLAKTNIIHPNQAANMKSKLAIYVNKLVAAATVQA